MDALPSAVTSTATTATNQANAQGRRWRVHEKNGGGRKKEQ